MSSVSIPSLFLPRVSSYHDDGYIADVFWHFLGTQNPPVDHVDMVAKQDTKTGQDYFIAFVFFRELEDDECEPWVREFAQDLEKGNKLKIVHAHPWYWQVSKNTGKKRMNSRPRILNEKDEIDIKKAQQAIMAARREQKKSSVEEN